MGFDRKMVLKVIRKSNMRFLISKCIRNCFNPATVRGSRISKTASVWDGCTVVDTTVGRYTYISSHTVVTQCKIGAFCSIASYCNIGSAGHPLAFASTSPVFLNGRNPLHKHFAKQEFCPYKRTVIGNDVWIGAHSVVKAGIQIGDGAVVGAGSVVTKDIGPYEIWGGGSGTFDP